MANILFKQTFFSRNGLASLTNLRSHSARMSTLNSSDRAESFVPSVDISPFLQDPTSLSGSRVVDIVRHACLRTGFFQITGHGIPPKIQKDRFRASQRFFALPMQEKENLDARTHVGHRGYDILASQTYHEDVLPDLKEGFYIGPDISPDDPVVQARRFFMGPNVWPDEALLESRLFRDPVNRYFTAVNGLALEIFRMITQTLPYTQSFFEKFTSGYVVTPLRLLHYPPARPVSTGSTQYGAGAHTDFGAITLLLQDDNPGLEIFDTESNTFVPIEPTPGGFVVNVGDMLSTWTGGLYKSSVHRVINKRPADRYSAAFFMDGNLDCPLGPLDGSKPEIDNWTVEKHMIKRIMDSYGADK